MVTVHRGGAMRFVVFVDDHEPAHVHVYGDGEARIDIRSGKILTNRRMSRAVAEVREH